VTVKGNLLFMKGSVRYEGSSVSCSDDEDCTSLKQADLGFPTANDHIHLILDFVA